MSGSPGRERLDELRTELSRSLAPVSRRRGFVTSRTARAGGGGRGAPPAPNGVRSALPDERGMRALAKEIKRLITEDSRRGIGV